MAPELAAEVVSPGDSHSYLHRKVLQCLGHGVRLVWVVDPERRTVMVYRSRRDVCVLGEGDRVTGHDVLRGFCCRVKEFFG